MAFTEPLHWPRLSTGNALMYLVMHVRFQPIFMEYLPCFGHSSMSWGHGSEQSDGKKCPHIPGIYVLVGERNILIKKIIKYMCFTYAPSGQDDKMFLHVITYEETED